MQTLLKAHQENKRIKVYVAEARPQGLGIKTCDMLTAAGIPCQVVLDSAVAYILERVDMVMVGTEAVVESGGLVSRIGTCQTAYLAKSMGKPFYALAESYKFLRYYPLRQADLPMPKRWGKRIPLEFESDQEENRPTQQDDQDSLEDRVQRERSEGPLLRSNLSNTSPNMTSTTTSTRYAMTPAMEQANPLVDITGPELVDLVITDLGAISATAISQYLVALFTS